MALVFLENSYLESADNYLTDFPDWENASDEAKEQALVDATTLLDQNTWIGSAVSETQLLAWPREVNAFFDPVLGLEVPIANDEVPIRLQKATAYLALHLIRYPSVVTDQYAQNYNELTVGPISLSNSSSARPTPKVPAQISKLIAPLIREGYSGNKWWRSQ